MFLVFTSMFYKEDFLRLSSCEGMYLTEFRVANEYSSPRVLVDLLV